MSEGTSKVEEIDPEAKMAELSDQDLDNVAGGWSQSSGGDQPMENTEKPA